jgi:hypothetical protein
MQSAAFDEDDNLYWAASFNSYTGGLYKIDLQAKKFNMICSFDDDNEVIALDPEPKPLADGVPAQATNLALNFESGSLSGTLSFDAPSVDNLGNELTETSNYVITIDGVAKYSGAALTGTNTIDVTVDNAGNHNFGVRLSNSVGEGRAAYLLQWLGVGSPQAVTDLTMTKTGDLQATITWTAPTASVNDYYFDASRLSYTITRMPDNEVVATGVKETQYVDNMTFEGQKYITYKVTPYADDVAGEIATSNGAVFGSAFVPPVTFDLDTEANYNLFTIIDTNETPSLDSGCWQYSPSGGCAGYNTGTVDGDDWFITPDIRLEAGRIYHFSYDVLCYSDYWPDEYAVYMGQGNTIEAMTTELVPPTTIYWDEYRRVDLTVTVEQDGIYNFGFHALSEAGGAFFLIDNISVTPSYMLKAPAAATDMTVVAGEKGAKSATVTFKAPTTTVDGSELVDMAELTQIDVLRAGEVVKSFTDVAAGNEYSFEETDLSEGMAEYTVVAYSDYGAGAEATASAWIGIDTPVEVPVSAEIVDGHPHITWTAPSEVGANGGYVDTSALTYIVYRPSDDTVLVNGSTGFEYTDTDTEVPATGDQKIYQYGVFARSKAGIGNPGSAFVVGGDKYELPFNESFARGNSDKLWIRSSTYSDNWSIDDEWNGISQDGDGGELVLVPYTPGSESTIFSGKIDMTKAHNPVLSFYVRPMNFDDTGFAETSADDDYLNIEIAGPDFHFNVVKTIQMKDYETGKYTRVEVPLDEFTGKDFIQVGFFAINGGARSPLMLDNISIANGYDDNLKVKEFSMPASADVLSTINAEVTIYNEGKNDASSYTVNLYKGDTVIETVTADQALASFESRTFSFELTVDADWNDSETFTAEVVATPDENADDNKAVCDLTVVRPNMPVATDLAGTCDEENNFTFTWTAPDLSEDLNVEESFEDYGHGDYKNIGDWTMLDEDGVYGFDDFKVGGEYIDIPHVLNQVSFMVIDPEQCEIDLASNPGWAPHSGSKMLVSFCNWELDNDDWVVTPQLSGNAQTITFWAKSGKADSGDCMYVYYSKEGKTADDFTRIEKVNLTDEWTKYEYEVPAGATYFAVRNYKYAGYAVLLDDFSFEKAPSSDSASSLEVLGYNLYRNGEKVNSELITDTTYTLADGQSGEYAVTVVYNVGESEISNTVYVERSSVDSIYSDEEEYPTYDLQGRMVKHLENGQIYIRKGKKFIYRTK